MSRETAFEKEVYSNLFSFLKHPQNFIMRDPDLYAELS